MHDDKGYALTKEEYLFLENGGDVEEMLKERGKMKCPICGGVNAGGLPWECYGYCMDTAAGKNKEATEHKGSGAVGKK